MISQSKTEKKRLREEILRKRDLISEEEIIIRSKKIAQKIRKQEFYQKADHILLFLSYASEVNTSYIYHMAKEDGKKIYAPRITDFKKSEMIFIQISDDTIYEINEKNIKEPVQSSSVYIQNENTLCISPGVVFDLNRNRIGYGKGFYDRFFEQYSCDIIGVCFDLQILVSIPSTINDKKMDLIISERRIV